MNNGLMDMLSIALVIAVVVLFVLIVVLIVVYAKGRPKNDKKDTQTVASQKSGKAPAPQVLDKQSIFNFMEFEKIRDNMIIQKNGLKYLMVVECQGINYDLMSGVEKNAVEEGFVQFLNTLRHPIQLYVQTRTVNLENSLGNYKYRIDAIEQELEKKEARLAQMKASGSYTKIQQEKLIYEIAKQKNLLEYGKDIVYNTEKMSLNKNVLRKQYYIVVPYSPTDISNSDFDKEEIGNIAFSELYTKAQSILRTLSACGVTGRILDSYGLADLLYTAYNRDQSEVYGLNKAIQAGYDELYSTAPDVMDKKIRQMNKQIEEEALKLAKDSVDKVKYAREEEYKQKEESFDDLVKEMAELIVNENQEYIGGDIAEQAIALIQGNTEEKKTEEKGGIGNDGQKAKRGRKPKRV